MLVEHCIVISIIILSMLSFVDIVDLCVGAGRGTCKMFDAESGTWTDLPYMPAMEYAYFGYVVVPRKACHRIYIFGGYHTAGSDYVGNECKFIDIEDNGKWTTIDERMSINRAWTCAVLLDHDTIVICGGNDQESFRSIRSCDRFDLTTHTFLSFPDMLTPRAGHAGVHYNGTIVVGGGYIDQTSTRTCEQFDPTIGEWRSFPYLNYTHVDAGWTVVGDMIYAVGGRNWKGEGIEIYDGWAWKALNIPPYAYTNINWSTAVTLGTNVAMFASTDDSMMMFDTATPRWNLIEKKTTFYHGRIYAVSF